MAYAYTTFHSLRTLPRRTTFTKTICNIDYVHLPELASTAEIFNAYKNRKGCDIGYALAASSCEGADSVDACTVTALDAIAAFAVPNPNCSSQKQSVFSGLVALQVALLSRSLSLLRTGKVYFANPFSRRRDTN